MTCPEFWASRPQVLVEGWREFFPFMEIDRRCTASALNSLTRFGVYLALILTLVKLNPAWLLVGLGFAVFAGSMEHRYLIMKNGNALVGLFQGMFAGNILTFNPGWDENASLQEHFDDVRTIQQQLKSKSVKLDTEADETTSGPASLMLTDPDGNVLLIDQHV